MNHDEAREYIEKVADCFDGIVNTFSSEKYYDEAKRQYEKSRKICRIIKISVFIVCIAIIVLHIWGI